jgi:acylpyruvate hydrolase
MRFATIANGPRRGLAVMHGSDLHAIYEDETGWRGDLLHLLQQGADVLLSAGRRVADAPAVAEGAVRYLPVLPNPGKIICVGLNYADHSRESGFKQPDHPTLFARFNSSLIGHRTPIVRPLASDTLDYEGEIAAIIGTGGRHIPRSSALAHVAGYALFNDASVREYQHRTPQWTLGKNFDGTGAFGPLFVTADELPGGLRGLRLETRLNGNVVQSASTDDLVFDVATLVSVISEAITLSPGDVIVTGTPSGVGHAREPRLYMHQGDICEVSVEGLGLLSNPIVDEQAIAETLLAEAIA